MCQQFPCMYVIAQVHATVGLLYAPQLQQPSISTSLVCAPCCHCADEANVDLVVPDHASMTMEERRARLRQIRKTVLAGYDAAARMVLQQYDADADEVLVKIGK